MVTVPSFATSGITFSLISENSIAATSEVISTSVVPEPIASKHTSSRILPSGRVMGVRLFSNQLMVTKPGLGLAIFPATLKPGRFPFRLLTPV